MLKQKEVVRYNPEMPKRFWDYPYNPITGFVVDHKRKKKIPNENISKR